MVYIWEAGCRQAGDEAGELGRTQIMLGLVIHAREGSKGPCDLMGRREPIRAGRLQQLLE